MSDFGRWLSNVPDAELRRHMHPEFTREITEYLVGKVVGPPMATDRHSIENLREMGMIGVYELAPSDERDARGER